MTKQNLLKFKELFEKRGMTKELEKVNKTLERLEVKPITKNILEKLSEEKAKK